MHVIRLAVFAVALFCTPAFAQQTDSQRAVIHPGAQRYAHIVLIESGALDLTIREVEQVLAPQLRKSLLEAPWAARLDDQKREQLASYGEALPGRLLEILRQQSPRIETALAITYSQEFTAEESGQIADYFGSANGRAFFKAITETTITKFVRTGQRPNPLDLVSSLTDEQVASLQAFMNTAGGVAFARVGADRSRVMSRDAITSTMADMLPALRTQLRTEVCAIVGEPCGLPM